MCGIGVVLDPGASAGGGERLRRMHGPIRHRGPDGEGFLAVAPDGSVTRADAAAALPEGGTTLGIAFRRLRILDLSEAAAQPMSSPDGRTWIAFNGEIYNFRALRAELAALGRAFRSTGDTEVLLAAYEAWGEGCFARLDGMWAVAIADLRRGRLVLSRDRFGIKPLYWSIDGGRLLVASEIKQILAAREGAPRAHAPLVRLFLAGTRYPCLEETFFEDVRAVPPASWCAVPLEGPIAPPRFQPYWELSAFRAEPERAPPYDEALERFRAALRSAVDAHAVADLTVGALLSGGLDSAALVALLAEAARAAGRECPTFSFGVRDAAPELCELGHAEAMARAHGLPNHQAGFDAAWLQAHAPAAIRAMEEPPLALPALAQYRTFQLCRQKGTTVVFDGQGADEVLGGYAYHQRLLLFDRLRRGRLRAFTRELRAIGRREHAGLAQLLGGLVLPVVRGRARRPPSWIAAGHGRRADTEELARARADRGSDTSAVNRQLYWDVRWGNVKIVLGYTDKNAMAHSVEARVPYFDRRLVELAFTLPDHYKVGQGQRKRILRDAARGTVPPQITERADRMGFGLPERELMRGLWPRVRPVVVETLLDGPCLDRRAAERLLENYDAGDESERRSVWRLYALALWTREFDARHG